MVDDIVEQLRPHIHEILRIVLDAKGRTLRELNELVGKSIQNYHVDIEGGEETSPPICVEFKHLRRSGRLAPTKRTYEKMQTNTSTGRPAKKLKLSGDNIITDALPVSEPATVYSTNEPVAKTSANLPMTSLSATSEPAINRSYIDNTNTVGNLQSSKVADLPTSPTHVDIEGGGIVSLSPEGDMFPMTHGDGLNILDEYFQQSPINSGPANNVEGLDKWLMSAAGSIHQGDAPEPTVWSNTPGVLAAPQHSSVAAMNTVSSGASDIPDPGQPASAAMSESTSSIGSSDPGSPSTNHTSCPPSETHHIAQDSASGLVYAPYVQRPILDESAQWLEHVLVALQAVDDTTRRPNSSVPGILDDILKEGDFTLCVKVMTSIAENLVKCSRRIAKPAVDIAQERSREVERTKFGPHGRRLTSQHASRALIRKDYSDSIACLTIRGLAEKEMQRLLSEPEELTAEFREEDDYETVMKHIEKENADDASARLRRLWKETYYWPMIQQRAKMIGPLPTPSGRED